MDLDIDKRMIPDGWGIVACPECGETVMENGCGGLPSILLFNSVGILMSSCKRNKEEYSIFNLNQMCSKRMGLIANLLRENNLKCKSCGNIITLESLICASKPLIYGPSSGSPTPSV
jgi:hypothetical protein